MDINEELAQELNIVRLGLMLGGVHEEIGNFKFAESWYQSAEEASRRIQDYCESEVKANGSTRHVKTSN
ncbi:hypothetical protein Pryu01_03088 [Paraliobacillus ryukyuensis]|uniref:Uncharacterized protein n=1 Tax=Paraliobacillus ryukyuensis TaxID=200904 RepID=A0A366DMF2_9BACI|nr:hypothetical protein DES48_1192 [Paraliobacillus ryukyuensis]